MLRQQKQCRQMLHWWHLIAQDLHHHRYLHAVMVQSPQLSAAAFHASAVPSSNPCKALPFNVETALPPELTVCRCVCRAVLESFRARHVRQEGVAVFDFWRNWAHWRALERRAIVAHWQKLMLLVRQATYESLSSYCGSVLANPKGSVLWCLPALRRQVKLVQFVVRVTTLLLHPAPVLL
jgi:hypothetical protein